MLTNCTEKELLNYTEFMDLIPHLPIEDLLLTEYKIESRWRKLIQLRDANKKLYHCSVCNVVQSGAKNLCAHIDGKKHKIKMRSIVQLYHPKYTYSKGNDQSPMSLNEKEPNCLKLSSTTDCIGNGEDKKENIMCSAEMTTTVTKADSVLKKNIFEGNDDISSVILIGGDKESKSRFSIDEGFKTADNYEPIPKKRKIVLNPAAITTKIDDMTTRNLNADYITPKYQSNITILPSKIRHKERALLSGNNSIELFSTKTYSCNPLNDSIIGLVGVEYVVKILKNSYDSHPKYECGLCEFTCDCMGMQNHLISYSHRLKFCEKHFPTAIRQYQQYIHNIPTNESYKIMTSILNKLAIAIEQHHGRELPYECLESKFNINRHEILSKVFSSRHASEQYGPTFTHIINSKEVDKLAAELDNYKPPTNFNRNIVFDLRKNACYNIHAKDHKRDHIPLTFSRQPENSQKARNKSRLSNAETINNETHKLMVEDFLKNTCRNRSLQFGNNFRQDQLNSESTTLVRHKSPTTLREHKVWQTYRHFVDHKVMNLNKLFQIYRTDPERHPLYDHEWQMFWKRRKNELIEVGLDHRTYNYQPEWVKFFNIRIEELYHQAVENIKIEARKILCLPMTNDTLEDEKYFIHSKDYPQKNIITNISEKYPKEETSEIVICSENLKVVSVLRLLTALEEYLGSLGPNIMKLLSKALQIEKNFPESLSSVILNEENLSLLETAKEKFRGLILTGILDDSKQRVLRKAIDEVEYLLANKNVRNEKHTWRLLETSLQMNENAANIRVTNILTQVDKKELAFKLADLLSAQGKIDVDPVQLQKIISVYMLIEKKKQQAFITSTHESNQGNRFETSNSGTQLARNHGNLFEKQSCIQKSINSQSATHQVNDCSHNKSFWEKITFNGNENGIFSKNYREDKGIGSSYHHLPQNVRQNASESKTTPCTTTRFLHSPQCKTQGQINRKRNACGMSLNWENF